MAKPKKVVGTAFSEEDFERVRDLARREYGLTPNLYLRMLAFRDLRNHEEREPMVAAAA